MSEGEGDGANEDHENAYVDHARWLLEWHQRRSEALMTRASAALAFTGVLLALLLQLVTRPGLDVGARTWWLLGGCLVLVCASAVASAMTLLTREEQAPAIWQLREQWTDYLKQKGSPSPPRDMAENFIVNLERPQRSPLKTAAEAADSRACWFKTAAVTLAAGTCVLAMLVADVAART